MRLGIGAKLITGFLAVAVVAGVIGGYGVLQIRALTDQGRKMYEVSVQGLELINDISEKFQRSRINTRGLPLFTAVNDREELMTKTRNNFSDIEKNFAAYEASIVDEEDRKNFDVLVRQFENFSAKTTHIMDLYEQGRDADGLAVIVSPEFKKICDEGTAILDVMSAYNSEFARAMHEQDTKTAAAALVIMIALVAVGVLAAIVLGLFLTRSILVVVNAVESASHQVSAGTEQVSSSSE